MFRFDTAWGPGEDLAGERPVRQWSGVSLEEWAAFRSDIRTLGAQAPGQGVVAGCASYDLGMLMEGVVSRHGTDPRLPFFHFGYYPGATRRPAGATRPGEERTAGGALMFSDHDAGSYAAMVRAALELIAAGDIYEINLSRRFRCRCDTSLAAARALYERLKRSAPAPYSALYDAGGFRILGVSPELLLESDGRGVRTRPMKGTRPRGSTSAEDALLAAELEQSGKERAELLMVTDLLRNDLGKVCVPGSVRVPALRTVEAFPAVFQASSAVEGVLASGRDGFDVFEAVFPGGSVTGCPKRRAMEVIDTLELSRRGYYTGALGYMVPGGGMTFSMVIRSLLLRDGEARFSTGGGVVADSDPAAEFAETEVKARGLIAAFG